MRNFAFDTATTVKEAAAAATLACEAMLAPDGGASDPETTIVKAGGIDLLDLMKEGLLAPAKVTSLGGVAGLSAIEPQDGGGLRIGALVTLARLASDENVRKLYPALADAAARFRQPGNPQRGDARRQSTATAALLVLPRRRSSAACARAAGIATRSTARTSTTRSSTTASARSCIPRLRRRRWSLSAPRWNSSTKTARLDASRWRISSSAPTRTCSARTICVRARS